MPASDVLLVHGAGDGARSPLARRLGEALAALHPIETCAGVEACLSRLEQGQVLVVVLDPDVPRPFAAARRLAKDRAELRYVFAVEPSREEALRREARYGAPPGGQWVLVPADDAAIVGHITSELAVARQQRRLRTTLDRMKLRLTPPEPVDSAEYRRLVVSDRYLAGVLAQAQDGIVTVDPDGRVRSWNRGAEQLFGRPEGAALGQPFAALFTDPAPVHAGLRAALAGVGGRIGASIAGASSVHVEVGLSTVSDDAGGPLGVVAIVRDVTERQRAEAELRTASRQKDEFLAMLAHELRNPLAPIRNGAQILLQLGSTDERVLPVAEVIGRQVEHMSGLLDDLLDVARVTRGAVVLEHERVPMHRVVSDAIEQSRALIEARRHELSARTDDPMLQVIGDRKRLTQVVTNLLVNAAKYTPPGGRLALTLSGGPGAVCLSVTDTGVGIEPTLLPRVFDLFTQAERSADRAQGGLGVGLAVVRSLVELHGGTVQAHSAGAGQGSRFEVTLPRAPQLAGADPVDSAPAMQPLRGAHARHVVVVDDNEDAAHTLGEVLTLVGYRVDVLFDPREALELAREAMPDAFVLDIGMPHIDGYELARRLRALPSRHRPLLVALSGYGLPADRARSAEAGFDHHLAKPADLGALERLLAGTGPRDAG